MPRKTWKALIGAVLLVSGGMATGARGAPDQAKEAKLTFTPLPNPAAVLSRPAGDCRFIEKSILPAIPAGALQFEPKKTEIEKSIAGQKVIFGLTGGNPAGFEVKFDGRATKLEREGGLAFRPVTLKLEGGRSYAIAFPYGFAYQTIERPGSKDQVTRGMLLMQSGGAQTFTVDGQAICLYDHNTDGYYRLADDSIGVVDPTAPVNVFAPMSKLFATPSGVYQIASLAEDGSRIEYVRVPEQTGTIAVTFGAPEAVARVAFTSPDTGLSFVVKAGGADAGGMAAMPGSYQLQYGAVYSPKTREPIATVSVGKMAAVDATAGKTQTIELGKPYAMEFTVEKTGKDYTISSANFHVRGKAGEEYRSFSWETEPEITLASGTKSVPVGKMKFG